MKGQTLVVRTLTLAALWLLFACGSVSAQTEEWVPAKPAAVVPKQLAVFTCDGQTRVAASWVFYDGGFRVVQTPVVSRSGQTVALDSRVEEWTGVRTLSVVPFEKTFDLGVLEPGAYTLDFESWGERLKQVQFTVPPEPSAAHQIDRPCFFVAQHYRDFLSREADGGGMSFWSNELNQCGADEQCLEVKRINVSAAFFLSIEFRQTGYFVYRVYKAALGRRPTFAEFVPDAASVGQRVVVGSTEPWATRLDGNKDTFTRVFFDRQEFVERYNGLTHEQYVDKLLETAGLALPRGERDELVRSLTDCPFTYGCPTRSNVLRRVAEHPALDRKEFNSAFVTMQYFGYLRRDPDEAGFRFWLDKLERHQGNFIEAELVKAFITSLEYRQRFGQQ